MRTNVQEMASRMGYITEEEFIDLAGITASTAEAWRKRGQGPDYALLGNKYYYSYESVAEALGGRQRTTEVRRRGRPPKNNRPENDSADATPVPQHDLGEGPMTKFTVEIQKPEGSDGYLLKINDFPTVMVMGTRSSIGPVRDAFVSHVVATLVQALKVVEAP